MNKNLEEIIEKIMNAVDVINEYGSYVDAYVKEQKKDYKSGLTVFLDIAKIIQKSMLFKENQDQYMKILDKAIKKFTEGDIIFELKKPLHNFGIDVDDFLDDITPEKVKTMIQEAVQNIDEEKMKEFVHKYQMTGEHYGE